MSVLKDLGTIRFLKHFSLKSLAVWGGCSGLIQFHAALFPEYAAKGFLVLSLVIFISIILGIIFSWPRPIEQEFSAPKTKISVVKGDILKQPGHIVIGMTDTFDTQTPNIISNNSLQGKAVQQLYGGDHVEFNKKIIEALISHLPVSVVQKEGKTDRYEIGTVAVVKDGPRKLFFSAYSSMNNNNEAKATADTVWRSLNMLWKSISAHGNNGVVSIPVIGGGSARLSSELPAQDSIRFIALSFMIASRQQKVCDELKIIVLPEDYYKLDKLEIQSFISSLRPS